MPFHSKKVVHIHKYIYSFQVMHIFFTFQLLLYFNPFILQSKHNSMIKLQIIGHLGEDCKTNEDTYREAFIAKQKTKLRPS